MQIMKQKGISSKGKGKWQSFESLTKYRKLRNKRNKIASNSRKRNK